MDIRHAVRYLRKQKGWTQAELAERVYTTNGNISNLESGQQGYSPSLLAYLAQAFGCFGIADFCVGGVFGWGCGSRVCANRVVVCAIAA